ncbi:hypothetical protein LMG22037_06435 [Paraburkholderia phenoliruptrix]|uniref:Uncharacterized protein n=1 Tax=Paraburkholderia phenoliruptrix TaxID=252970 RepID=A0A6J5CRS0_9BURK|nr:hypothetical protein LMG22037_06435 [Paraburkholderia phenoliruptrix]
MVGRFLMAIESMRWSELSLVGKNRSLAGTD